MTAGRLLAVNVGRPREIEWEGKTVRTAIWKEPVEGPRMVRRINIDGDDHADRLAHGGEHRAVFVYQIDSYRYWERQLGRDDFVYGQFAENLTVEGLADDEVCIGDRYRIGEALFEVTQPRVTCYRVGIRMNEPAMPTLLVAHHRPGFYFRVREEGVVQAGDEIEKVADGPEQLTVAEIDGLLYLTNKSRALIERALRVQALSEGWQRSFRELLARDDGGTPTAPAWAGFHRLRVAAIRRESSTISSFLLVPIDDSAPAPVATPGNTSPCGWRATMASSRCAQLFPVGCRRRAGVPDQRQARRRR
jgi:MOSC domain-containing protein YiiM